MKLFIIITFFCIGLNLSDAIGSERIRVEIAGDSVVICNDSVYANCCAVFISEFTIQDTIIKIFQTDTSTEKCWCMCYFDMIHGFKHRLTGKYTAEIYRREFVKYLYPSDTTYLVGSIFFDAGFWVGWDPPLYNFLQGDCNNQTSVESEDMTKNIGTYPNPANDIAFIELYIDNDAAAILQVFNVFGDVVLNNHNISLTRGISQINVNLTGLPSGVYLCKIILSDVRQFYRKLVKQ